MNHWNHKSPETGWTSADGPTDKEILGFVCEIVLVLAALAVFVIGWRWLLP